MATRTHTVYFGDDSLTVLDAAINTLRQDAGKRRAYISPEAFQAIDTRLAVLDSARALLAEPVPSSFE